MCHKPPWHTTVWQRRAEDLHRGRGSPGVCSLFRKPLIPLLCAAPVPGLYPMPDQYSLRYRLVLLKAATTMRYFASSVSMTSVMFAPGTAALSTASPSDILHARDQCHSGASHGKHETHVQRMIRRTLGAGASMSRVWMLHRSTVVDEPRTGSSCRVKRVRACVVLRRYSRHAARAEHHAALTPDSQCKLTLTAPQI
jgi:hypothetical protein